DADLVAAGNCRISSCCVTQQMRTKYHETHRNGLYEITVRKQADKIWFDAMENRMFGVDSCRYAAVFTNSILHYAPAQHSRHSLQAVTNAKQRQGTIPNIRVRSRRGPDMRAGRTAGNDNSAVARLEFGPSCLER